MMVMVVSLLDWQEQTPFAGGRDGRVALTLHICDEDFAAGARKSFAPNA
jgi:hypothetical protein